MKRTPRNGVCHLMTRSFLATRGMKLPPASIEVIAVLDTLREWHEVHIACISSLPEFLAAIRPSAVEVFAAEADDAATIAALELFARDACAGTVH